jgi:hypothetical protein
MQKKKQPIASHMQYAHLIVIYAFFLTQLSAYEPYIGVSMTSLLVHSDAQPTVVVACLIWGSDSLANTFAISSFDSEPFWPQINTKLHALYILSEFSGIRNLSSLNDLNSLNSLSGLGDLKSLISSKNLLCLRLPSALAPK